MPKGPTIDHLLNKQYFLFDMSRGTNKSDS